jgi:hypothetical protein
MKIPKAISSPASVGGQATPDVAGSGQGLAEIGQAVSQAGDVAGHLFEQEMNGRVSGALGQATRELHDLGLEVEKNPDHNSRTALYAKGSSEIAARLRESIGSPKFQQDFDLRFEGTLEHGRMKVAHGVRQSSLASSRANRLLAIETYQDAIKNEPDPVEKRKLLDKIHKEIRLGLEGGLWDAEWAANAKIQADNRFEGETLIAHSQSLSDEIWDNHTTQKARLSEARTLSGELRTLVTGLLKQRKTEEDGFDAEATNEDLTVLIQAAQPGGIYPPTQKPLTQVDLEVEVLRRKLEGRPMDSRNVASISNIIASRDANTGPVAPYSTYATLLRMARDPLRRPAFLSMNLPVQFAGQLLKDQLDKLVTNQAAGVWKFPKDTVDRVDRALAAQGLLFTNEAWKTAGAEDRAKSEAFRATVDDALRTAEHMKQQPLSGEEAQKVINALSDPVVINRDYVSAHERIPLGGVTEETKVGGVPEKEGEEIRARLIARGELDPQYDEYRVYEPHDVTELIRDKYRDLLLARQRAVGIGASR